MRRTARRSAGATTIEVGAPQGTATGISFAKRTRIAGETSAATEAPIASRTRIAGAAHATGEPQ